MNNRRQFLKKSFLAGLLGFIAPNLIKNNNPITKPKFDYGYYPTSKIPKFKYVFDGCEIKDIPICGKSVGIFNCWNDKEKLCFEIHGNWDKVFLKDTREKILLKDFSYNIMWRHDRSCNVFGPLEKIENVEIKPLKFEVEFYIA